MMKKILWKLVYPYIPFILVTVSAGAENPAHATLSVFSNKILPTEIVPIRLQPAVQEFVEDYLEINSEMLKDIREKYTSQFIAIEKILDKKGIPQELKYLAVVESKLKTSATSHAGAAGVWQLMPRTARLLGLRVSGKTDERRHLHTSTKAAAKYLNDLYEEFDDWLLVIAAYNGGSGTVYKAIKKSGSRDFWKLQHFLPKETRMHVKKFIATHYFFEQSGSLVTLTKAERLKHLALVKAAGEKNDPSENQGPANRFFNWILITHDEQNNLKAITRR
jgi:membrane-bound lytic murein transglycosylase D